jgi:uncharacterized membrane protein YoaK (UPF0700 family)
METAMSALKSDGHGAERFSALTASAIASAAGGAMDAWVYMVHGVFATAQSGNVVLASIALAGGDLKLAATHLPSLLAFSVGLLISRWCAQLIKRRHRNSRNIRLGVECLMLVALGLVAARLPDHIVTACIGFIAAVQVTSLSHIGSWSFSTGMMTGNLRSGATALVKAATGSSEEWSHAGAMFVLCVAFAVGAAAGAWLTPRAGPTTLVAVAALIALAIAAGPPDLDPIPEWSKLD